MDDERTSFDIGKRIKERREALGMSQEELAHKIGYKHKSSINKFENYRDIPIKKLKPIADALDIDVWELAGWEDATPETKADAAAEIITNPELLHYVEKLLALDDNARNQIYSLIDLLSK